MTKAAAYIRVSTEMQTTDNQLPAAAAFGKVSTRNKRWTSTAGIEVIRFIRETERGSEMWEQVVNEELLKELESHENYWLVSRMETISQNIRSVSYAIRKLRAKFTSQELKEAYWLDHWNYDKKIAYPVFDSSLKRLTNELKHFNNYVTDNVTANRQCPVCGSSFNYKRADAQYCSGKCKQSAYRKALRRLSLKDKVTA